MKTYCKREASGDAAVSDVLEMKMMTYCRYCFRWSSCRFQRDAGDAMPREMVIASSGDCSLQPQMKVPSKNPPKVGDGVTFYIPEADENFSRMNPEASKNAPSRDLAVSCVLCCPFSNRKLPLLESSETESPWSLLEPTFQNGWSLSLDAAAVIIWWRSLWYHVVLSPKLLMVIR